ncbi:MAG: hypothetical protein A4E48_00857 [Methanosaeta sp. PtaU1.Bin060]|nr:MAG: hypothetical protein A4E48_00857 [Methanosaeta sp. PtaU1.Bin060]
MNRISIKYLNFVFDLNLVNMKKIPVLEHMSKSNSTGLYESYNKNVMRSEGLEAAR